MPGNVKRTISVFISYRREGGFYLAKNIYDDLKAHKYDVFMDLHSLGAGDFESKTLAEIAARDYFVIVLTIGSMERMLNDGDWLRRELAAALDADRTIVPVLDVKFDFAADDVRRTIAALPVSLRLITSFNAVRMPPFEYFDDAMARLRRFLTPKPGTTPQAPRSKPHELAQAESILKPYDAVSPTRLTGVERKTLSWSAVQDKLFGIEPLQLTTPRLTNYLLLGLGWTEVPGATKYVLERSADRNFTSSTVVYEGTDTSYNDFGQLWTNKRTTFYRVKAVGARALSKDSEWSNIYEQKAMAPRLSTPVLTAGPLSGCSWTEVKGAKKYVLEQSGDPTFASPTVAYEGTNTSYFNFGAFSRLRRVPGERILYRVKAVGVPGTSRDSEWSNIHEEKPATLTRLAAPVLKADPFGGCSWTEVKGAAKYILEQSEHENFASSTVAYEGANTSYFNFAQRATSQTFYRVKAVALVGADSGWSNVIPANHL